MKIRKYRKSDLVEVSKLIQKTYGRFNKKEGKLLAVRRYVNCFSTNKKNLKKIIDRYEGTPIFYVAVNKGEIVGMVRGREGRIVNLFVDGSLHGMGIGRGLVKKFEEEERNSRFKEIKINSSLYAVLFYHKMGYVKTTGIRNFYGISVQPMRKIL